MRLIGIDAGRNGAVALLDTKDNSTQLWDLETLDDGTLDACWFFELLNEHKPEHAIIESVFRPVSLIRMAGEFEAICKLYGINLLRIAVCTWKIELLDENTSDKKKSIVKCKSLFPTAKINRLTPKKKKASPNPDRAEALLLAEYLNRYLNHSLKKSGKK